MAQVRKALFVNDSNPEGSDTFFNVKSLLMVCLPLPEAKKELDLDALLVLKDSLGRKVSKDLIAQIRQGTKVF